MSEILEELQSLKDKVKSGSASAAEKLRLRRLRLELDEVNLAKKTAKLTERKRAEETKMKIILGTWVLHNSKNKEMCELVVKSLPGFLSEKDKVFMMDFIEKSKLV